LGVCAWVNDFPSLPCSYHISCTVFYISGQKLMKPSNKPFFFLILAKTYVFLILIKLISFEFLQTVCNGLQATNFFPTSGGDGTRC
jgi:hypothetical protein